MAVLTNPQRADLSAEIQRVPYENRADCPGSLSKAELRAAVNAIDDWWDTTGAALANAALPLAARNGMSARQKAALFMRYLAQRYEVTP